MKINVETPAESEDELEEEAPRAAPGDVDEFDYESEVKNRTELAPFIITHDEFFENEPEYEQTQLTYFEGDDVLADGKEQPVEEVVVGEENLVKFGHGSKDKNIVYVRNPVIEVDFEIQRSTGTFVEEVLGFGEDEDASLKHSARRKGVRKFREFDD